MAVDSKYRDEEHATHHDVYGGDPNHAHQWTWTPDNHGHMGYECPCGAYRP